jgi:hypothetical protein
VPTWFSFLEYIMLSKRTKERIRRNRDKRLTDQPMIALCSGKPWETENDYEYFMYRNVPCAVIRNPIFGYLCGYIAVPLNHPWFTNPETRVSTTAHGGITFSATGIKRDPCSLDGDKCHGTLGFDCGGRRDYSPIPEEGHPENYRTMDYVLAVVRKLALEAKSVKRFKFKDNVLSPWG